MNQVQLQIDTFFKKNVSIPKTVKIKEIKKEIQAKLLLEPLFIREIPNDLRYINQLEEEYELIDKNNFAPVFLQVRTVLEIIKSLGPNPPPHIIRGSAGSSLVTYLLGITHVDPIKNSIQLARVIPEAKRNDLFNWAVLEGKGIQTKPGTIEVSKIKGIAINKLV